MCGIVGVFNTKGSAVEKKYLQQMTDAITHRGPDGEGFYWDNYLGFGHRRLAVIDLSSAAHQPMVSVDKQYAITYNGEIYNFQEIRDKLEKKGYIFRSKSDTEVVLNAYIEWQEQCVNYFNGMFAFAIWDQAKRELFLARDRYGIKPLYYVFHNGILLFASEQKALLSYPGLNRELDFEGLLEYFTFQNIFTHKTLLKNIHMFPAGHYAKIQLHDTSNKLSSVSYWDFNFAEPEVVKSEDEYLEELQRLFVQAVNRQLISDVEVGSYLSGGIDSGSITAVAAKHHPYLKTFTCGFDLRSASGLELGFDERSKAEYMSYLFKTEHYESVMKAGDMEWILPKLAYHLEEPRVGQSYPNYYIAKLASKFVKVVLSGAGGDELFAGYPWRYYHGMANENLPQYIDHYYSFWQRLLTDEERHAIFAPSMSHVKHISTRDIFSSVFEKPALIDSSPESYINNSLYFEAKTFLHGLLVVEDKLSMAHGLETRLPFLDNDLVDFAMRLPLKMKLKDFNSTLRVNENEPGKSIKYFQKTKDGKIILRKAMERYVPVEILNGDKQGFSAPDASWFKGESIEFIRKILLDSQARIYEIFDAHAVQNLINEHLTGKKNRRLYIWSLLNFETWLNIFMS